MRYCEILTKVYSDELPIYFLSGCKVVICNKIISIKVNRGLFNSDMNVLICYDRFISPIFTKYKYLPYRERKDIILL